MIYVIFVVISGDVPVRVGVSPCEEAGSVIHWKDLDNLGADLLGEIGEFLNVEEFADTEAILGAKSEHRDGDSGTAPIERFLLSIKARIFVRFDQRQIQLR
jgi:hypothetical protein